MKRRNREGIYYPIHTLSLVVFKARLGRALGDMV